MRLKLSELELEILRKLVNGETVLVSSQQRVRLELAGMIREGAAGIAVTLAGKNLARQEPDSAPANEPALDTKVTRDRRGRRLPLRRESIF